MDTARNTYWVRKNLARNLQREWASWFNRIRPEPRWECNALPRNKWSSYGYIMRLTWLYVRDAIYGI